MTMLPNVVIEMEKIRSPYNGLGNFCRHFGKSLLAQAQQQFSPTFYIPRKQLGFFGDSANYQPLHKWHRYLHRFAPKAKIWHILHQDSRYWPPQKNIPLILTIHDLNFLHVGKKPSRVNAHKKRIQKLIQRASVITTISHFSKQEIETYLQPNIPIEVIYNGVELDFKNPKKPAFIQSRPYLLALGEVSPKKNFHVLVNLLAHLPQYDLYIVGKQQTAYTKKILSLAQALRISNRIHLTGPVTEKEKTWLYQHCEAFLFPSLAEGFGLPVIEAMRCGRPVFISKNTALQEIGGEFAYFFNDFTIDHMLSVFQSGMKNFQSLQPNVSAKIQSWSKQFRWEVAAKQYIKLYHTFLNAK